MHWRSHVCCLFLVLRLLFVRAAVHDSESQRVTVPVSQNDSPSRANSKDLTPSTTTITGHHTHTVTLTPVVSDGSTFIPHLTHHITDPFHRSQNPAFTDPPTVPPAIATSLFGPSDDGSGQDNNNNGTSSGASAKSHHLSPAGIFFAVAGSIIGVALLVLSARCVYRYRRTPGRDRIANIIDRHRLERELVEMDGAGPQGNRGSVVRNPPPPYQRAPEYTDVVGLSPIGPSPTVSPTPTNRTYPFTPSTSTTPVSAMSARSDRPLIHGYMRSIGSSEGSEHG